MYAYQTQSSATSTDTASPTEPAPQTAAELDALVAPIALYPDNLVAQILGAATFPDQVAIADYWVQQNKTLTGSALGTAVDQQTWDASVKALVQFPDVLDNMANNLAWTSSLGQAFHDQQADVMTAVQVMRQKAQAAGTLKSTPQIQVTQPAVQTIVIQPANPQVVYVPQYNPMVVYGTRYVVPFYTPPPRWLYIGADNYPFPIPLGQKSPGQWSFDTAAGKDEILARRIGKDELTAIAACAVVSNAQKLTSATITTATK